MADAKSLTLEHGALGLPRDELMCHGPMHMCLVQPGESGGTEAAVALPAAPAAEPQVLRLLRSDELARKSVQVRHRCSLASAAAGEPMP